MRGSIVTWRSLPVIAVLILATACSVTDYKQPVSDFATATQDAETALVALNDEVTEAYAEKLRMELVAGQKLLVVNVHDGNKECQVVSQRCRLAAKTASGSEIAPPEPLLGNLVAIMAGITTYSENLAALVNAETAAEVSTHVNAALGSVENLAKTVDKISNTNNAKPISDYKTSLGKAANWLVGQYVAKVQLDGLRAATSAANPVIARTTQIAEAAADLTNIDYADGVDAAFQTLDVSRTAGNLNSLIAKADAYDQVLRANPAPVYAQLRQAHEALTKNLNNEDVSFVEVMAKIEAFAKEAKTVKDIVDEIRAVNDN